MSLHPILVAVVGLIILFMIGLFLEFALKRQDMILDALLIFIGAFLSGCISLAFFILSFIAGNTFFSLIFPDRYIKGQLTIIEIDLFFILGFTIFIGYYISSSRDEKA